MLYCSGFNELKSYPSISWKLEQLCQQPGSVQSNKSLKTNKTKRSEQQFRLNLESFWSPKRSRQNVSVWKCQSANFFQKCIFWLRLFVCPFVSFFFLKAGNFLIKSKKSKVIFSLVRNKSKAWTTKKLVQARHKKLMFWSELIELRSKILELLKQRNWGLAALKKNFGSERDWTHLMKERFLEKIYLYSGS